MLNTVSHFKETNQTTTKAKTKATLTRMFKIKRQKTNVSNTEKLAPSKLLMRL